MKCAFPNIDEQKCLVIFNMAAVSHNVRRSKVYVAYFV